MTSSLNLGSYFIALLHGINLLLILCHACLWERFICNQNSDLRDRRAREKAVILVDYFV